MLRTSVEEQYEKMRGARLYRNIDFILYVAVVVLLALGIRTFLAEPVRVEGDSMVPTLLNNEHMFVEKVGYWVEKPARGDIIICYYPGYTESCVKRVIALPGETVSVQNGQVQIDGRVLNESNYWNGEIYGDMEPLRVADQQVFVMGDNRNGSKDSRNPAVGCIPYEKIVGQVRMVIWPPQFFRAIPKEGYTNGNVQ